MLSGVVLDVGETNGGTERHGGRGSRHERHGGGDDLVAGGHAGSGITDVQRRSPAGDT